jgi:hypothetical protein
LHGFIADASGSRIVRGQQSIDPLHPESGGRALAREVRSRGGEDLVVRMSEAQGVPSPQPE